MKTTILCIHSLLIYQKLSKNKAPKTQKIEIGERKVSYHSCRKKCLIKNNKRLKFARLRIKPQTGNKIIHGIFILI